jgi:hypothetical protein
MQNLELLGGPGAHRPRLGEPAPRDHSHGRHRFRPQRRISRLTAVTSTICTCSLSSAITSRRHSHHLRHAILQARAEAMSDPSCRVCRVRRFFPNTPSPLERTTGRSLLQRSSPRHRAPAVAIPRLTPSQPRRMLRAGRGDWPPARSRGCETMFGGASLTRPPARLARFAVHPRALPASTCRERVLTPQSSSVPSAMLEKDDRTGFRHLEDYFRRPPRLRLSTYP